MRQVFGNVELFHRVACPQIANAPVETVCLLSGGKEFVLRVCVCGMLKPAVEGSMVAVTNRIIGQRFG